MYRQPTEPGEVRCPLEYGLQVFGGKWKSRIICVLAGRGSLRYGELRRQMANISDAVLASMLKELVADDVVSRTSYDEIPPHVEYALTEKGLSVVPVLQEICRWAGLYRKEDVEGVLPQCRTCDYRG